MVHVENAHDDWTYNLTKQNSEAKVYLWEHLGFVWGGGERKKERRVRKLGLGNERERKQVSEL